MSGVVLVTARVPRIDSGGRLVRTYTVLAALARSQPVDVVYIAHPGDVVGPQFQALEGVSFHPVAQARGARRLASYARARALRRYPTHYAMAVWRELPDAVAALAAGGAPRLVVADGLSMAAALMIDPRLRDRIVMLGHNVDHLLIRANAPRRVLYRRGVRGLEARALRTVRETWQTTRADIDAARELAPGARLRLVPNAVAVPPAPGPRPPHPRVIVIGDYRVRPNRLGLEHLVRDVMPLVWEQRPDAIVEGAGRDAPPALAGPRVELPGFVDDLDGLYRRASCAVVPLSEGSGSSIKFLEALAHGVPVVSTPVGARGVDAAAGVHYLGGSTPRELADGILRALAGEAGGIAAAGRDLVARSHSVEALDRILREALAALA